MSSVDLSAWLGRSQTFEDALDAGQARRIAATLSCPIPAAGDTLSALWHWCYFLENVPSAEIGLDGHPERGGFLPPANNRNRMWAGGRVTFEGDLKIGVPARKTSTIKNIQEKQGKTGALLFVTLTHEIEQLGRRVIIEEQDIVYREPSPPKLTGTEVQPVAQWQRTIEPTPVLLFRYSAITFNAHRIHYDYPYVTEQEGYPGLVVHGPMLATFMVQAFQAANPQARLKHLNYRGLRPMVCPTPFEVGGTVESPGAAQLWISQGGTLAHQAQLTFE
jgi:itaconyl-CoA hydratase/mesaconyl-C4 CoA hydratase